MVKAKRSKSKTARQSTLKKIQSYAKGHKIIASSVIIAVFLVIAVGVIIFPNTFSSIKGLFNAGQTDTAATTPEITELENNADELARLDISQDAIDNTDPVRTSQGQCDGDSVYHDDGNGHFSVASRLSDGSWQCVTYDLKNLQDYESSDGKTSIKSSTDANGKKTTITKSTDETGSTTTTTTTTNPDGSGQSSTDGGYSKSIIGPTRDGRQIYGYFDYSDNRYYTDIGRFQSCFLTMNTYVYSDGNTYNDGTYRELSASEKAAQAAGDNCNRLPKVRYEPAHYDLALLKKCLREGQKSSNFDSATCYRKAEK